MATIKVIDDLAATTRTFYEFESVTVGGLEMFQYVGTPTIKKLDEDAPANATRIQPHVLEKGTAYWSEADGQWYVAFDIKAMGDDGLRKALRIAAEKQFSEDMKTVNAAYPSSERDTWSTQLDEAKTVLAGGTSALLSSMVLEGESPKDLATKIVAKSDAYKTALGTALGARRMAKAKANTAKLEDEAKELGIGLLALYSLYNALEKEPT